MNAPHWTFVVTVLFGLLSATGVWMCFWYQRIGWTITLASNILLISYGAWSGQWGFSIAVPLAAAAQLHHLYRSRREPWAGRRVPAGTPARRARGWMRRRTFRHEVPLQYAPGRAPAPTATPTVILSNTIEPEPRIAPLVGVTCPCGCGVFAPSEFVAHLEVNRGNMRHWAMMNRG